MIGVQECKIPDIALREPCSLGVDEAGRGPVLGPMVYGFAFWTPKDNEYFSNYGFMDSKVLTATRRKELYDKLQSEPDFGYSVQILSAKDISNCMLRQNKYNLNELSHNTVIDTIEDLLKRGVKIKDVWVDTVGDPSKYQDKLTRRFKDITFVVSKKADSLFPCVSGASIMAKVTRDENLETFQFEESVDASVDFGSGYPADPNTVEWLKNNSDKVFAFPSIARFSWGTVKTFIEKNCIEFEWPDDAVLARKREWSNYSKDDSLFSHYGLE